MKKIFNILLVSLFIMGISSCDPQEDDLIKLGNVVPASDIKVSITADNNDPNLFHFALSNPHCVGLFSCPEAGIINKSGVEFSQKVIWAGDYDLKVQVMNKAGISEEATIPFNVLNTDPEICNNQIFRSLTGGCDDENGKIWVFDQYNNFATEVANATGKKIIGHIGLGPSGSYGQDWWGAEPEAKSEWSMYSFKLNFILIGAKLNIQNEGKGYGRLANVASAGFTGIVGEGEDASFDYSGGSYTFSIDESGTYPKLTLSGNAFMGYYVSGQSYEIIYLTDKAMALRVNSPTEGQDWVFVYCLEELNVPK